MTENVTNCSDQCQCECDERVAATGSPTGADIFAAALGQGLRALGAIPAPGEPVEHPRLGSPTALATPTPNVVVAAVDRVVETAGAVDRANRDHQVAVQELFRLLDRAGLLGAGLDVMEVPNA